MRVGVWDAAGLLSSGEAGDYSTIRAGEISTGQCAADCCRAASLGKVLIATL